jgi:diguanylate cyclase
MLGRSHSDPAPPALAASAVEMAIDTLAAVVRTLGEYAMDQEGTDAPAFCELADGWAQHLLLATPPPGGPSIASSEGRRDWMGVREFVRGYCRGASTYARATTGDLRQVVWVFIQSFNHVFAESRETDGRIREQLSRLEHLSENLATSDLKREVLATVMAVSQMMEERREQQRVRIEQLGAQVQTLGNELESARRDSETDPLTRLYNRRAFDEYMSRSIDLYRVFGSEMCLLVVDVDRFKALNDAAGHVVGDEILKRIADAAIRVFLRKNDFVARYGGDELIAVLRDTGLAESLRLAARLLRLVRGIQVEHEGSMLPITVSIGVAQLAPGQDGAAWVQAADQCLYQAKNAGRDRAAGK